MSYKQSMYGITDKLADFYLSIAILCAIAAFSIIIISKPHLWYVGLIIAPFAAWMGPIAILLPLCCLEGVGYGLLHLKESYKSVLGFLAFFALLFGGMIIATGMVRFCATYFATPDPSTWEYAYVSESPNSYCYHYSENCKALRKTSYDIETLSVEDAEDCDYKPCSFCLKESVSEQWDDAAGFLFIPISCLLYWSMNKIRLFFEKYKFRNPIAKR